MKEKDALKVFSAMMEGTKSTLGTAGYEVAIAILGELAAALPGVDWKQIGRKYAEQCIERAFAIKGISKAQQMQVAEAAALFRKEWAEMDAKHARIDN